MKTWKDAYGNGIPKMSEQELTQFAEHLASSMRKMTHVEPKRFMDVHMNALQKLARQYGASKDISSHGRERDAYQASLRKTKVLLKVAEPHQLGRKLLKNDNHLECTLAFDLEPASVREAPVVIWPILAIGAELMNIKGTRGGGETQRLTSTALVRESASIGSAELLRSLDWIRAEKGKEQERRARVLSWLADTRRSWTPIDCWRSFPGPRPRAGGLDKNGWEVAAQAAHVETLVISGACSRSRALDLAAFEVEATLETHKDPRGALERSIRRARAGRNE